MTEQWTEERHRKANKEYLERVCDEIMKFKKGVNAHEDKETRLERKTWDSKHCHERPSREYNDRLGKSTENLGDLY